MLPSVNQMMMKRWMAKHAFSRLTVKAKGIRMPKEALKLQTVRMMRRKKAMEVVSK